MMENALAAAGRLLQFLPFIHERFLNPMEREVDVSKQQLFALMLLYRKGANTMSGLAGCMHISKQQLTQLVDKLLKLQYVVRETDPEDRRVVRIRISDVGVEMVETRMRQSRERLAVKLDALSAEELGELSDMMSRIMELVDKAERLTKMKQTEDGGV